jgi:protein-disulfide isomerase
VTRRFALAALAACAAGAPKARAEGYAFALETPEGAVIRNFAIPKALAPADLPGVLLAGAAKAAPVLYDFFDYACPYCRLASQELDLLLGPEGGLRVGLLHHPVLGAGSEQAALAVLAAKSVFGEAAALRLHARLIAQPGRAGAAKALALAGELGLDPDRLRREAARAETRSILDAQAGRAVALGLRQTPAFVLGGYAFIGWPGPELAQNFARAVERCGGLACSEGAR